MLFLSCLEKPRSIEEVSILYKVPTTLFYRKNFLNEVVEKGIFKLEYVGRKPFLYSLFTEEFKNYFQISLTMLPTSRDLIDSFLDDINVLITFFDTTYFRGFWKEDVLRTLNKHHFKDPLLLTSLFSTTVALLTMIVLAVEKYKLPFEVAKTTLQTGKSFLLTKKAFPFNVSIGFAETIIKNLSRDDYIHCVLLKDTKVYRFLSRLFDEFVSSVSRSFLESLTKTFKKHKMI